MKMKTNKLLREFWILFGICFLISFLLLIFLPITFVPSPLTGFLFGFSLCFPLFLLLAYLYYRTEKLEKGKLLLKVKSSPLDVMGKKNKKYFYVVCIIMTISACVIAYISFSSFPYFLLLAVSITIFPLILKIKGTYEFYEKGIRFRVRFMPWKDFKSYKKEGNKIILIADIKHFWEKLWKGNLYFGDKNGKIEKCLERKIKKGKLKRINMAKLTLKYLPLAWVAVLLTSLTFEITKVLGIDLDAIKDVLGISSTWTLALLIYDTFQLVTVLFLLYLLRKEVSFKEIGFRRAHLKYYFFALIFLLIVQFIWDASEFIVNKIGLPMLWWNGENVAPIKTLSDFLILLIFPVFFCSVLEEVLYRGYILTATLQRLDPKLAFLINSLIFASIHYAYGPGTMLFIFFWNFIPCWLYFKSKSIYPSILFHSANNLIGYVILPLL